MPRFKTRGADGECVDVFIGPHPESELVFVVDQLNKDGSFDEHKCLVGFQTVAEARRGYLRNYPPGWKGFGAITPLTMPQFKRWVAEGNTRKPLAEAKAVQLATDPDGDDKDPRFKPALALALTLWQRLGLPRPDRPTLDRLKACLRKTLAKLPRDADARRVRRAVEHLVDDLRRELDQLAAEHALDDPDRWFGLTMAAMLAGYVASAFAGSGKPELTPPEQRSLEAILEQQAGLLARFRDAVASGPRPGDMRITTRAGMYAAPALAAYENVRRESQAAAGQAEARRVLDPRAKHCDGCVIEASRDWVPVASLRPLGSCECREGCRCHVEYRGGAELGTADIEAVLGAGEAHESPDHCPECGKHYKMRCRCNIGDRTCPDGHSWHWCAVHKRRVPGNGHGKEAGPDGCRCGGAELATDGADQWKDDDEPKHADPVPEDLWAAIRALPWPKDRPPSLPFLVGEADGKKIKVVDFDPIKVRDEMDAIEGMNGFRYPHLVPKDEVWLDANVAPHEWPAICLHECFETRLMKDGHEYNTAHMRANGVERQVRNRRALTLATNALGGEQAVDPDAARESDFVTFGEDVPDGATCKNCRWNVKGVCGQKVMARRKPQPVTPRNCCKWWDRPGTVRDWQEAQEMGTLLIAAALPAADAVGPLLEGWDAELTRLAPDGAAGAKEVLPLLLDGWSAEVAGLGGATLATGEVADRPFDETKHPRETEEHGDKKPGEFAPKEQPALSPQAREVLERIESGQIATRNALSNYHRALPAEQRGGLMDWLREIRVHLGMPAEAPEGRAVNFSAIQSRLQEMGRLAHPGDAAANDLIGRLRRLQSGEMGDDEAANLSNHAAQLAPRMTPEQAGRVARMTGMTDSPTYLPNRLGDLVRDHATITMNNRAHARYERAERERRDQALMAEKGDLARAEREAPAHAEEAAWDRWLTAKRAAERRLAQLEAERPELEQRARMAHEWSEQAAWQEWLEQKRAAERRLAELEEEKPRLLQREREAPALAEEGWWDRWRRSEGRASAGGVPLEDLLEDDDAIAKVLGAPDGSRFIKADKLKAWDSQYSDDVPLKADGFDVSVRHPELRNAKFFIGADHEGKKFVQIRLLVAKEKGTGVGSRMVESLVHGAAGDGFSYVQLHAAGSSRSDMNGYYTWPRLGWDQAIDDIADTNHNLWERVDAKFPNCRTVLDVMATKEGRDWWKKNGGDLYDARFDLTEGSRSRRVLDAYLEERRKAERDLATEFGGGDGEARHPQMDLAPWEEEALERAWKRLEEEGGV